MSPSTDQYLSYLVILVISFITSKSIALDNYLTDSQGSIKHDPKVSKNLNENNTTIVSENYLRYNRQLDTDVKNRFHINANTIIRTGESRVLGAKYVNETILPSNHDCLTWCLETPNCNVAVYEEKNVQSCYLFDCGSPIKFLCKFTQHNFFVSSILKVTQHSYDLSQWGNQVKHEKELAELRINENQVSSSPSPIDPETVTSSLPASNPKNSTKPESQCHHYQFKCVNNSECIAIYNVCDGIPQCPDGSDESPDLKCHEKVHVKETTNKIIRPVEHPQPSENKVSNADSGPKPSPPSPAIHIPQNVHISQPIDKPKVQQNRAGSRHTEKPKSVWPDRQHDGQPSRSDYYPRTEESESDGLGSPFIHKHSQFVAANDPHVQSLNRWSSDYDQYPSHPAPSDQQYNPYEGNYQRGDDQYLPNPLSPEYDAVKNYGSYRQEDVPYWANQDAVQENTYPVEEFPQPGMHSLNKPNNYPDKESLYAQQLARTVAQYPETKHRIIHKPMDILPAVQPNRASEIEEYKSRRYPVHRQPPYMAYEEALEKQLSSYPDMKTMPYDTSRNLDESMYNNDDLIRASLVHQLPMEIDHPHHPYQYEKHMEEKAVPHAKNKNLENVEDKSSKFHTKDDSLIIVKPTPHPKPVQKTVLDFKMSVTELYQASRTHTQETNSAILALVMGLTITFLLFVFLACRIKTIRKRMSRKGRALAHDADYLVNGMYL